MKKIRFIHGADLHLDSLFKGLKKLPEPIFKRVRESTFESLDVLVKHAIHNHVDFILLAGDLFDGEDRSFQAQSKLKKAMEKLQSKGIPCYIIHGNHDHIQGNWLPLSWPENCFFFKDTIEFALYRKADTTVHIYGYSYPKKSVKENIATHYSKKGEADFHIGLLHGTAEGQEGHDSYAPFSIKQLVEKEFDYWALGHIHKRQVLHEDPYVVYPGNTQGRHRKELGEKGVYLVEISNLEATSLKFLPTSQICWEEITISITGIKEVDVLKNQCEVALDQTKRFVEGVFVILRFIGVGPLHNYLLEHLEDFIEVVNLGQEDKSAFTYVIDQKLETSGEWDREALKKEQHLLKDIITVADQLNDHKEPLHEVLAEVYSNPKLRRYLSPFSIEEQRQIMKEAEDYIIATMIKEMDE